jgi:CBS domain containing-hemolysin-like protein
MNFWIFLEQFGVTAFIVFASGFFVAAEFAIVKVRLSQLRLLQGSGDWRVPFAIRVNKKLDAYLSTTQVGITVSNLVLGAVGEPYVSKWLEPLFLRLAFLAPDLADDITRIVSFALITFILIVVGELMPKLLAIQRPKAVSLWVSPPLFFLYYSLWPFITILNSSANLLLRWVGLPAAHEHEQGFSMDELQHILLTSTHSHSADEYINRIMLKALQLKNTTSEQIMLPAESVSVLWRDKSIEENLHAAQRAGYSRMPVCGASLDEVLGVVLIKELLWQFQALGSETQLSPLIRPVLTFLPETKLPSMLELFRKSRNHFAVVVSRDDKMLGIVSFEDVLEELVGDIRDEFDIEKGPIYERTHTSALVDASLPLRDLAIETGWDLPKDSAETVGRWAQKLWGKIPGEGEILHLKELRLEVVAAEVSIRGLRRIRLIHSPAPVNDNDLNS